MHSSTSRAGAVLVATGLALVLAHASATPASAGILSKPLPVHSHAAAGKTLYVSVNGSNRNPGTLASPFRTLQHAANVAVAGVTIVIRGGTYAGFTLRRSGLAGAPIVFRSFRGERVVVKGDLNHPDVIDLVDVQHVRIIGLTVRDAPTRKGSGIRAYRSHHIAVAKNRILRNHSFGVLVEESTYVTVKRNSIFGNATGVRVRYGGEGVVIASNRIFRNTRMTVNDATPGNDTGGQGIAFEKSSGGVARNNRIWGNRANSHDYGEDGTGIEIYGSSNLRITRNRIWNNRSVLETGTNDLYECANNKFTHNVAWSSTADTATGLVLRCAKDGLVAHNTFDGLTWWAMQLSHKSGSYGDSIAGLRVFNNVVNGIKSFHINTSLPSSVQLDYNLVWAPDKHVAYVAGHGYTKSLAEFRGWTGYERHGLSSAPRFVDGAKRNYRLRATSPAIDEGLTGVTSGGYAGAAPDLGRYEYRRR